MATLRSFAGVRYNPAVVPDLAAVVCPPYDVISPTAQSALYARSPYNVVRLELGREEPTDTAADNRYTRAAATYQEWHARAILRTDEAPGLDVYDEEFVVGGRRITRRSLIGAVRLARFEENVVLPHEHTLPGAKADRLRLLEATHTQFSPILGTYDDPGGIRTALAEVTRDEPLVEFALTPGAVAAAATTHRLWRLTRPGLVADLVAAWQTLSIFIADGHHRYETALTYRDARRAAGAGPDAASEFVLMALVAMGDPGLVVLPTHRLVRGLPDLDPGHVLDALARLFEVEHILAEDADPAAVGAGDRPSFAVLGLAARGFHRLTLRSTVDLAAALPDVPPALRALDTLVLQRLIFEPVLGLSREEAEAGGRIQYTRDPEEARHAVASGQAQLVFFLRPTPLEQIRAATRAGQRMPQKTTYFYPKPVTGLVFFDHDVAF